ncbi:MICOS complex subunit MIC25 isoform X1 [Panthera leo]|uniref:MICOS complex subunit MIC25 isoform X1 n=2 Tax=Panthera leo TaxID=9689 RepID=UPI001C695472|nr:MICOS complex subunit MIC25 isoform X1 [Panthera leo]
MGSTESSEARRVSFGMDEEERVRVLQGIRLSENVVNRMKDPNQPCKAGEPAPPPAPPSSTPSTGGSSKGPEKDSKPPRSEYGGGRQPSGVEEDFLKRYKQEQAKVQDELFQVVTREREAATKHRSASMQRGEGSVDQDKRKSTQLARELESREAELSRRDTFYKEQLGRLERKGDGSVMVVVRVEAQMGVQMNKSWPSAGVLVNVSRRMNAEMYKLSSQQFHEAASKMEGTIKPRRTEPVCSGLQAQILRCYRDHLQEVLLCSDLVKAYQHCVSAAHKG